MRQLVIPEYSPERTASLRLLRALVATASFAVAAIEARRVGVDGAKRAPLDGMLPTAKPLPLRGCVHIYIAHKVMTMRGWRASTCVRVKSFAVRSRDVLCTVSCASVPTLLLHVGGALP